MNEFVNAPVLYVFLTQRPKNGRRIRYQFSQMELKDYDNGYNGFGWLILAKLYLFKDYSKFVSCNNYKILLLNKKNEEDKSYREWARKKKKRNKIIKFLELLKNGI